MCSHPSPEVGLQDCRGRNTGRAANSAVVLCGGVRDEFKGGREEVLFVSVNTS